MKVAIGSDHAGFAFKEAIKEMLVEAGHEVTDHGTHSTERADYPDYAVVVGRAVAARESEFGVLVCGSGIGVSIAANKVEGIRAATCISTQMSLLARAHNNANIVCIGERLLSLFEAKVIVRVFLSTAFEGGRHTGRVDKIHALTGR